MRGVLLWYHQLRHFGQASKPGLLGDKACRYQFEQRDTTATRGVSVFSGGGDAILSRKSIWRRLSRTVPCLFYIMFTRLIQRSNLRANT